MSAYIVENRTINKVVNFLMTIIKKGDGYYINEKLSKLGFDLQTEEGREKLANAMYVLNISGVTNRYGTADDMIGDNFKYSLGDFAGSIQSFKALQCWMYQCMEGELPEKSKLYKLFDDEIRPFVAEYIINRLPEYDEAVWG